MGLNPRMKISIQIEEGDEEWLDIMKQEFKERLIQGNCDYFSIREEDKENMTVYFKPRMYTSQKEFLESFEKNVMEPARKAAGLEQTK